MHPVPCRLLAVGAAGIEAISAQELALVEQAVTTKLILDSVNAWLLTQPTLINRKAKSVVRVPPRPRRSDFTARVFSRTKRRRI